MGLGGKKIIVPELDFEEIARVAARQYEEAKSNPTAFLNWFSSVQKLNIPAPETEVVQVPLDVQRMIQSIESEADQKAVFEALKPFADKIREFGGQHGYPVFIRNSLFSGKHSWRNTCFVKDANAPIEAQITSIFYEWAMVGWGQYACDLVIRKFIPADAPFSAFLDMPITKEFRFFARDGALEGFQPYWPAGALETANPSKDGWREDLERLHLCDAVLMEQMKEYARSITEVLGGYWSVDFLIDTDGNPWLIDMAEGDKSFMCADGYREIAA